MREGGDSYAAAFLGARGETSFTNMKAGGLWVPAFRGDDTRRERRVLQPQLLPALAERAQAERVELDALRGSALVAIEPEDVGAFPAR